MGSADVDETFTIPTWLNNDLFSKTLSKELNRHISVVDFCAEAAVSKGDNYLSTLYRIMVQYREMGDDDVKKYYLVVKALPCGELIQKFLSDLNGFEKEWHMYTHVFPAMYSIMKSVKGKIRPLSARSLPCEQEKTLILEDLKFLGYKMANRHQGLDLDHSKLTVRALARLHAYSVALYQSDKSSMDMFEEGFYVTDEEKKKIMQTLFESNITTIASKIEKWSGYEHYAERIKKRIPTAIDDMINAVVPNKNSLNVLNHGDCWVNNMLFHYCSDTGKVEDVRFVDFQIARFSSPALDLQYFLVTSPTDEVRYQHKEDLLEEYHDELTMSLKALNLNPSALTLKQLKEEYEEKELFGFLTACTVLCPVLADKNDVPDFSELKEDALVNSQENVMEKAFGGQIFRERFQKLLQHYDRKGLI